jgi:uncharacterized protein YbjT (DUF2867 family)
VQEGLLDATAAVALGARQAGVSRLINLVMLRSSLDAPTPRMRQNFLSEQVFEWAGIGAVHIRAAVFFESVAARLWQSMPAQGAVRMPLGGESTVLPMVAGEDVGHVAAGLFSAPKLVAGTAYPLIGTTLSLGEIIATFGRVLGKSVRYEEISDEEWRHESLERGINAHAVEHLSNLWRTLRSAAINPDDPRFSVTDTIEKVGGKTPKSFENFVREREIEFMR